MKRYQEHLSGSGSTWTKKYKPISIEKIIPNASPFDEDRYVKEYMAKYGMEKVRGGSYVLEELTEFQEEALKVELWGASDKCTVCGRSGHWAKNCHAKTDVTGKAIIYQEEDTEESEEEEDVEMWQCEFCERLFETRFGCAVHEKACQKKKSTTKKNACYRCGRQGHYASDCYASTHVRGYDLDD